MSDILTDLNRRFDHAALHPETTEADITRLCEEARKYSFYAVAINPVWTSHAVSLLKDSKTKVLSVSGFPLGASRTDVKVIEAVRGVADGATEIDMVANIGWLAAGEFKRASEEIRIMRENLPYNVVLKVIIEAGKLSAEQQREATRAVIDGGAQFVKTCTGFFGGASVEQVRNLVEAAGGKIEVKASGGIRTLEQCRELLAAGADRLGSSASAGIMEEYHKQLHDKK